jgi:hypothetical protein
VGNGTVDKARWGRARRRWWPDGEPNEGRPKPTDRVACLEERRKTREGAAAQPLTPLLIGVKVFLAGSGKRSHF